MSKINIIVVGYNEEMNLSKFFDSLNFLNALCDVRVIYCDQGSTDKSLQIAESYNVETYQHGKKGYCEWSRKWAIDNLFENGEWILVLDCDEEISKSLAKEILNTISSKDIGIAKIPKNTIAFGMPVGIEYAIRLFRKGIIEVTDTIHEYIKIVDEPYIILKNHLDNNDLKEVKGNEMFNWIEKANKYSEKDYLKYEHYNYIVLFLFIKPLESFFYFYIIKGLIKYKLRGFIYSVMQGIYQFIKYSKIILSKL